MRLQKERRYILNIYFLEQIQKSIRQKVKENQISDNEISSINIENIENAELELAEKLNTIEEFSVDRFEENIAVLENRKTREISNVDKNELPENVREGSIIDKINGKYEFNEEKTKEIEKEIKDKMDN